MALYNTSLIIIIISHHHLSSSSSSSLIIITTETQRLRQQNSAYIPNRSIEPDIKHFILEAFHGHSSPPFQIPGDASWFEAFLQPAFRYVFSVGSPVTLIKHIIQKSQHLIITISQNHRSSKSSNHKSSVITPSKIIKSLVIRNHNELYSFL